MNKAFSTLFTPTSIYSIVFFRIAFGAISLWKVIDYIAQGRVARYWLEPAYNFTYSFFPWVTSLPGEGMTYLFYGLGILSVFVMLGFLYRPSILLLGLGDSYTFLLEETRYLNHDYLVILLCFTLFFIPASKHFSLDALLFKRKTDDTLPNWCLYVLRFNIGLPYFFGGIAKLNADWLLGEPMGLWLSRRTNFPLIGNYFTQDWFVYFATYGGLFLDLLAVPFLLWSRTRTFMFAALVLFHFTNARWFSIGIFPWLMIAATTLFFPPDWPKRLLYRLKNEPVRIGLAALIGGVAFATAGLWFYEKFALPVMLVSFIAGALFMVSLLKPFTYRPHPDVVEAPSRGRRILVTGVLIAWVLVHTLLPLRHWLIPGNPSWTEEGHRFAWHMLLRSKQGTLSYLVTDPASGQRLELDPADILPRWQVNKVSSSPHLIHEFAHYIAQKFAEDGFENVEVRAISQSSLNGREPQFLVSPTVNLAAEPLNSWNAEWIEPLDEPLRKGTLETSAEPLKEEGD